MLVISAPLPGDVERRAVGHAGPHDRQPQRDVHRAMHPQELQRDVPLVVVHGDNGVETPVASLHHERVDRQRPFEVQARPPASLDGRDDDPVFFVAEQPALAAMRIEAQTAVRGRRP